MRRTKIYININYPSLSQPVFIGHISHLLITPGGKLTRHRFGQEHGLFSATENLTQSWLCQSHGNGFSGLAPVTA